MNMRDVLKNSPANNARPRQEPTMSDMLTQSGEAEHPRPYDEFAPKRPMVVPPLAGRTPNLEQLESALAEHLNQSKLATLARNFCDIGYGDMMELNIQLNEVVETLKAQNKLQRNDELVSFDVVLHTWAKNYLAPKVEAKLDNTWTKE